MTLFSFFRLFQRRAIDRESLRPIDKSIGASSVVECRSFSASGAKTMARSPVEHSSESTVYPDKT
eukprot:3557853-Rhodomonas_salina.2